MSDLVSVLTRFQLYASGMNEESFEHNPLNVGFLYIKKIKDTSKMMNVHVQKSKFPGISHSTDFHIWVF